MNISIERLLSPFALVAAILLVGATTSDVASAHNDASTTESHGPNIGQHWHRDRNEKPFARRNPDGSISAWWFYARGTSQQTVIGYALCLALPGKSCYDKTSILYWKARSDWHEHTFRGLKKNEKKYRFEWWMVRRGFRDAPHHVDDRLL